MAILGTDGGGQYGPLLRLPRQGLELLSSNPHFLQSLACIQVAALTPRERKVRTCNVWFLVVSVWAVGAWCLIRTSRRPCFVSANSTFRVGHLPLGRLHTGTGANESTSNGTHGRASSTRSMAMILSSAGGRIRYAGLPSLPNNQCLAHSAQSQAHRESQPNLQTIAERQMQT